MFDSSLLRFVLLGVHVVLSDLLRFTDSDYPFGIFKLFLLTFFLIYLRTLMTNTISISCNIRVV